MSEATKKPAAARPAARSGRGRLSTGVPGLDAVLGGGLPEHRLYVVAGEPGSGKTTLALQFLCAGRAAGERVLFVTLSESREELGEIAASHGWSLEGLDVLELSAAEDLLAAESQYTLFHPSEVELGDTVRGILEEVERIQPARVVFDSLSEMRLLARDSLRFRRQILALKRHFSRRDTTVILIDDKVREDSDLQVDSIAHGVIALEQLARDYGAERRRLRVQKLRGVKYSGGYHDFSIQTGGIVVYPRLRPSLERASSALEQIESGVADLDRLLGGGIERGTTTLLTGSPGTGKSSVALQYVAAAARRGEISALFSIDERLSTYMARARSLGAGLDEYVADGKVFIDQIDPAEMSPGELAARIQSCVEKHGARLVVIDSLNGCLHAMPGERALTLQLHELLTYLAERGVATIMIVAQHGILNLETASPIDLTYLADTVVLLRHFEAMGEMRKAISIVKKRSGRHEISIREFQVTPSGVRVGQPLREFQGVLRGVPVYRGGDGPLLEYEGQRLGG
jgi:circadian clock protein KaiC